MLPVTSHEVKTSRWPDVTICLIGINVIAFVFETTVGARFVPFLQEWGLVPGRVQAEVTVHNLLTVFTSMFLHVSWFHLIGNMWFLYVFGDAVEHALGRWWYLLLYLVSGFFGGMAYIAAGHAAPIPGIGASGAIAGVLAASLVMWPKARLRVPRVLLAIVVLLFVYRILLLIGVPTVLLGGSGFFVVSGLVAVLLSRHAGSRARALIKAVPVPASVVLGLFFGVQLWSGVMALVNPAYGGSVGYWAHVGGMVAGATCALIFPKQPLALPKRAIME
jgi:membrane associated rhomboid family serine protease